MSCQDDDLASRGCSARHRSGSCFHFLCRVVRQGSWHWHGCLPREMMSSPSQVPFPFRLQIPMPSFLYLLAYQCWYYYRANVLLVTLTACLRDAAGTKRIKYLEENVAALDVKLSAEEVAELTAMIPEDAVSQHPRPMVHLSCAACDLQLRSMQ